MYATETNVTPDSEYFLYEPSASAKTLFFYPVCLGRYTYLKSYSLDRTAYDSFLIMHIISGSCTVWCGDNKLVAKSGQTVLINCYLPHGYSSECGWSSEWLHFDGVMAKTYFEHISSDGIAVIETDKPDRLDSDFRQLFDSCSSSSVIYEAEVSLAITDMLTELMRSKANTSPLRKNITGIDEVTSYINSHLTEDLSLSFLADMAHLSPYYFTRVFKSHTGHTPHEYIITARLNHSKFLLKNTTLTIKEICFACGFANESRFCNSFKNNIKMTPLEYRNGTF